MLPSCKRCLTTTTWSQHLHCQTERSVGICHRSESITTKKLKKIRVVFDSIAKCNGISVNSILLTRPNLNNSLLGIFIRFRRERVAVMADTEQRFHCFVMREDHSDMTLCGAWVLRRRRTCLYTYCARSYHSVTKNPGFPLRVKPETLQDRI